MELWDLMAGGELHCWPPLSPAREPLLGNDGETPRVREGGG
jgi:hypothetical protein